MNKRCSCLNLKIDSIAIILINSEPSTPACGSEAAPRRAAGSPLHTDSDVIQTRVTRRDTNKPRDTSASRRDTSASRRDTSATRRDTSASRRDTIISRRETDENRRDSRSVTPESDSCLDRQEGRSRRPRKQVVYREKPLNRYVFYKRYFSTIYAQSF